MTTTTLTETTPTETKPVTGCGLPCPRCGETGACISLALNCLADDNACTCAECDAEFGVAEVKEFIEKWSPVLTWIQAFPVNE